MKEDWGVVFLANKHTAVESLDTLIFGMTATNWALVERISVGTPVFLYNYSTSMMSGSFKAITPGIYNLNPRAFGNTQLFPAQVKVAYDCEAPDQPVECFRHIPGLLDPTDKVRRKLSREQVLEIQEVFQSSLESEGGVDAVTFPPQLLPEGLPMPGGPSLLPPMLLPSELSEHALPEAFLPQRVVFEAAPAPPSKRRVHAGPTGSDAHPARGFGWADGAAPSGDLKQPGVRGNVELTTLKVQNIPRRWSTDRIADVLEDCGFGDSYDFLIWQPSGSHGQAHGVAIINMKTPQLAGAVFTASAELERHWPEPRKASNHEKTLRWNRHQGAAHLMRLNAAPVSLVGRPVQWHLPDDTALFFNLPGGSVGPQPPRRSASVKRGAPSREGQSSGKRQKTQQAAPAASTRAQRAIPVAQTSSTTAAAVKQPVPANAVPSKGFGQQTRPTSAAASTAHPKVVAVAQSSAKAAAATTLQLTAFKAGQQRIPIRATTHLPPDLERRLNTALSSRPGPQPAAAAASTAATRGPLTTKQTLTAVKKPPATSSKQNAAVAKGLAAAVPTTTTHVTGATQAASKPLVPKMSGSKPLSWDEIIEQRKRRQQQQQHSNGQAAGRSQPASLLQTEPISKAEDARTAVAPPRDDVAAPSTARQQLGGPVGSAHDVAGAEGAMGGPPRLAILAASRIIAQAPTQNGPPAATPQPDLLAGAASRPAIAKEGRGSGTSVRLPTEPSRDPISQCVPSNAEPDKGRSVSGVGTQGAAASAKGGSISGQDSDPGAIELGDDFVLL